MFRAALALPTNSWTTVRPFFSSPHFLIHAESRRSPSFPACQTRQEELGGRCRVWGFRNAVPRPRRAHSGTGGVGRVSRLPRRALYRAPGGRGLGSYDAALRRATYCLRHKGLGYPRPQGLHCLRRAGGACRAQRGVPWGVYPCGKEPQWRHT